MNGLTKRLALQYENLEHARRNRNIWLIGSLGGVAVGALLYSTISEGIGEIISIASVIGGTLKLVDDQRTVSNERIEMESLVEKASHLH